MTLASFMSWSAYNLVIFEDAGFVNLLPLVYVRGVSQLRCGCTSLRERICRVLGHDQPTLYVRSELAAVTAQCPQVRVAQKSTGPTPTLFVNGRCLLGDKIAPANGNLVGRQGNQVAYIWADAKLSAKLTAEVFADDTKLQESLTSIAGVETDVKLINYPWDLIGQNSWALAQDWRYLGGGDCAERICAGAHLLARDNISIGAGTVVKPGCVLDGENGPIIIGNNVTLEPNSTLEGPLFIGDNSIIRAGAVLREGTSIGPACKVGGEVAESIIHSCANKQHDGFLGHSYLGQWVNIGAGTVTSDLKNTYGTIAVPINGRSVDSGRMFVGLTMGDHSKTGVNTTFATGSVVGFASCVCCSQVAPKFVPSFSWLTDTEHASARLEKMLETAQRVMARRDVTMTAADKELFLNIPQRAQQIEKAG